MSDTRRFAVKPEATRARLDDLAVSEGWTLIQDQTRTHLGLTRRQWKDPEGHVAWFEDHTLGTRNLLLTGSDATEAKVLATVPCFSRQELERSAACPEPDVSPIAALRCLRSLIALDHEDRQPTTLTLLAPWCRHPNVTVRRAAHHLVLCLAGLDLLPLLDELGANDADLAAMWKHTAERIREHFSVE